jgi:hypothetical protein
LQGANGTYQSSFDKTPRFLLIIKGATDPTESMDTVEKLRVECTRFIVVYLGRDIVDLFS